MVELNGIYFELKVLNSVEFIWIVFVFVDLNCDLIERFLEYVSYFNEEFIVVIGEYKVLFLFVCNLGMMYVIVESIDNFNYLVDYSVFVVFVDFEVRVIGRFKLKRELGKLLISDF